MGKNIVISDILRGGGLQAPYGLPIAPYFPKFMLFYVTWPSIQQGLQIDNILVNCLCAHT